MPARSVVICVAGGAASAVAFWHFEAQLLFTIFKPASLQELRIAEIEFGFLAGLFLALPVALVAKPVDGASCIAYVAAFFLSSFTALFISYLQQGMPLDEKVKKASLIFSLLDFWAVLAMACFVFGLVKIRPARA